MIKKIIAVFIVLTLILGLSLISFATAFEEKAVAVKGIPVIDGEMDALWQTAKEYSTDEDRFGTDDAGLGAKAKFRLAWDAKNLYFYAVVKDSLLNADNETDWQQDSICIQVEEDNSKKGTLKDGVDKNFFVNYKNMVSGNGVSADGSPYVDGTKSKVVQSVTKIVDGGYVVEGKINMVETKLAPGTKIGFEISVMDADKTGVRKNLYGWNSPIDDTWKDTSLLGDVEMLRGVGDPITVTGVSIDKSLTLKVKGTKQLVASIKPANATNKTLTWTSSNSAVASVDAKGKVTAKKAGKATITVKSKDGSKTATCVVTVKK